MSAEEPLPFAIRTNSARSRVRSESRHGMIPPSGVTVSLLLAVSLVGCQKDDPGKDPTGTDTTTDPTSPVAPPDPGFMPMHRLNNTEYANTIRDLLYTDYQLAVTFPPDPVDHGFDNVAELLSVSPLLVEVYEAAATEVLDEVFEDKDEVNTPYPLQAEGVGPYYDGGTALATAYSLAGGGSGSFPYTLDHTGTYEVTVHAWGRESGGEPPVMRVLIDNLEIEEFAVTAAAPGADYVVTWPISKGTNTVKVEFVNPDESGQRALVLDWVLVQGPTDPEVGRSDGYQTIVEACDSVALGEDACADQILATFTERAWRRPVTEEEVGWVISVYDEAVGLGLSYDESLKAAMKAALLAPEFVFRVEADAVDGPRQLDGYELASRLSYFLWASMPDEELFAAAADGSLLTEEGLTAQVERMVDDEKAHALVDSFAAQWLDARTIDVMSPVMVIYPDFDEPLRRSMKEELLRDAEPYLLGNQPVSGLFTDETTWVDERLAEHYGVAFDPAQGEWQALDVPSRRGVTMTAGWLASHSHAERPSVVLRGESVLEDMLCGTVPPPPPGVDGSVLIVEGLGSVREQEELVRMSEGTTCVTCHAQMDPYGHAFGNFDGIGALRSADELGFPIDTNVVLPTGEEVQSFVDALDVLVSDPRFAECVAEKSLRYALGRELRIEDGRYMAAYTDTFVSSDLAFEALVTSIVLSDPFRMKGPLVAE